MVWVTLTVEHILLNCLDFNLFRQKHFTCTVADLFSNVPSRAIVDFIKEIGLYHKLWILLGYFQPYLYSHKPISTLVLRKLWILNGVFTTPPPSVLLLYVIRMYPFLHLYYFNRLYTAVPQCFIANKCGSYQRDWTLLKTLNFKRGLNNPTIVSFTIIRFSHPSVFTCVSFTRLHKTVSIKFLHFMKYAQALIAILRWCAVKKPFKQTNRYRYSTNRYFWVDVNFTCDIRRLIGGISNR